MAYRGLRGSDPFVSKTSRNERFAQMNKQEQIIQQKKMEIMAKLEAQQQKAAAKSVKLIVSHTETSSRNVASSSLPRDSVTNTTASSASATPLSSINSNTTNTTKVIGKAEEKASLSSSAAGNVFVNDGSFLDQFKKIANNKTSDPPASVTKNQEKREADNFERTRWDNHHQQLDKEEAKEEDKNAQKRDWEKHGQRQRRQRWSRADSDEQRRSRSRSSSRSRSPSPARQQSYKNFNSKSSAGNSLGSHQNYRHQQVPTMSNAPQQAPPFSQQQPSSFAPGPSVIPALMSQPIMQPQLMPNMGMRPHLVQHPGHVNHHPNMGQRMSMNNLGSGNGFPGMDGNHPRSMTMAPPPPHLLCQPPSMPNTNVPPPSLQQAQHLQKCLPPPVDIQNLMPTNMPPPNVLSQMRPSLPPPAPGQTTTIMVSVAGGPPATATTAVVLPSRPPPTARVMSSVPPPNLNVPPPNVMQNSAQCQPPQPLLSTSYPTIAPSQQQPVPMSALGPPPPPPPSVSNVLLPPPVQPPPSSVGLMRTCEQQEAQQLAKMVAEFGDEVEQEAREKNTQNPNLWFLHQKQSAAYLQYRGLVSKFRAEKSGFANAAGVAAKRASNSGAELYCPEEAFSDNDDGDKLVQNHQTNVESKEERKRKRRSRWGDPDNKVKILPIEASVMNQQQPGQVPIINPIVQIPGNVLPLKAGTSKSTTPMLTKISRNDPGLMQYARQTFGSLDITEEQWEQAQDHYKINLFYLEQVKKNEEKKRLMAQGKHKYEYDSDEEMDGGTWEHKIRSAEMESTLPKAEELNANGEGKHHIGDFLPSDELKKFMENYNAIKQGKEPDLSDYKEHKLKEDNIGFQMLQKLGWNQGQGLGSEGSGRTEPVNKAANRLDSSGLGTERPDGISQDDDEFEAYRKRMMLAYRFRPNPLNNPRRPYY